MFMTVFAIVIAVCKDLPDVKGDIEYNVKTLPATVLFPPPINSQQSNPCTFLSDKRSYSISREQLRHDDDIGLYSISRMKPL